MTLGSGNAGWTIAGGDTDTLIYTVSTTGTDTGTVYVDADISWIDDNDPGAGVWTASDSYPIYVKEPSGLRIISVTSNAPNNSLLPNTSIVNTGQHFEVTVTVENTGGDDLRDVLVALESNGGTATITETTPSPRPSLPSGASGDFLYDVSSAVTGNEILSAEIMEAYSVNTGEPVEPIQASESVENMQVQLRADLVTSTYVIWPDGAMDDTLSTEQDFIYAAIVENTGETELDASGELTLSLPSGFSLVNPGSDPLIKSFTAGQEVTWTLLAPATALAPAVPQPVFTSITVIPLDINLELGAFVQKDADPVSIVIEDKAANTGCEAAVSSPLGSRDRILSTGQDFTVTLKVTPSANSRNNTATIVLPMEFTTTGGNMRQLGDGDGTEKTAEWTVTAPDRIVSAEGFTFSTAGTDVNSGKTFIGCPSAMDVDVVNRAVLDLDARISDPVEAREGNLSVDLPFTITAVVTNLGDAGIDATGARLQIVLLGESYKLAGSNEMQPFYPGEDVEWNLIAPNHAEPPSIITVQFAAPHATDENTNESVEYQTNDIPIGVTTESGTITMQNMSDLDSIPPAVVPRGADDVPVMSIVFKNNSAYTVGMDTLYVSIEDGNGNLRSDPSRYVSEVTMGAGGQSWSGQVVSANPVPILVDQQFTLQKGASDTALVSIDVAAAAPDGELRINLARSDDVVFSNASGGSKIKVVRDANGEDIAGFFYNTPLSVMSASFEEYVHNYPNPFRAGDEVTKIAYFLTQDSSVNIMIYDYTGVLVWTKDIPAGGPGGSGVPGGTWWEADWDGRNGRGEVVRNGVYVCKVTAGGKSAMFKIAVAK